MALSPVTGGYLLIVVSEPRHDKDKQAMLQFLANGLTSWDGQRCGVSLQAELDAALKAEPHMEHFKYGECLMQHLTEGVVSEVLVNPQVYTLHQCLRNMLTSFSRHRHIIHAGHCLASNGSWILQDGTFSVNDLVDVLQDPDVEYISRTYHESLTLHVHTPADFAWRSHKLLKTPSVGMTSITINPPSSGTVETSRLQPFVDHVATLLKPMPLDELMPTSEIVGNIRFSRPTLYVFPAGQGNAAMFGVNGFSLMVDSGFGRRTSCWNFVRHLDRLDAVLMTQTSVGNELSMRSLLHRRIGGARFPQIGRFLVNLVASKNYRREQETMAADNTLLLDEIHLNNDMLHSLKQLNLKPMLCLTTGSDVPINLYNKVGHGKLDLYVLNPRRDSQEIQRFIRNNVEGVENTKITVKLGGKEFPVANLVSLCCLLCWIPDDKEDKITRIMFTGSVPQQRIFEGLDRVKSLEFMKVPICSVKMQNRKTREKTLEQILRRTTRGSSVPSRDGSALDGHVKNRTRSSSRQSREFQYSTVKPKTDSNRTSNTRTVDICDGPGNAQKSGNKQLKPKLTMPKAEHRVTDAKKKKLSNEHSVGTNKTSALPAHSSSALKKPKTNTQRSVSQQSKDNSKLKSPESRSIKDKHAKVHHLQTEKGRNTENPIEHCSHMTDKSNIVEVPISGVIMGIAPVKIEVKSHGKDHMLSTQGSLDSGDYSRDVETDSMELHNLKEKESPISTPSADLASKIQIMKDNDIRMKSDTTGKDAEISEPLVAREKRDVTLPLPRLEAATVVALKTPDEVADLPDDDSTHTDEHEIYQSRTKIHRTEARHARGSSIDHSVIDTSIEECTLDTTHDTCTTASIGDADMTHDASMMYKSPAIVECSSKSSEVHGETRSMSQLHKKSHDHTEVSSKTDTKQVGYMENIKPDANPSSGLQLTTASMSSERPAPDKQEAVDKNYERNDEKQVMNIENIEIASSDSPLQLEKALEESVAAIGSKNEHTGHSHAPTEQNIKRDEPAQMPTDIGAEIKNISQKEDAESPSTKNETKDINRDPLGTSEHEAEQTVHGQKFIVSHEEKSNQSDQQSATPSVKLTEEFSSHCDMNEPRFREKLHSIGELQAEQWVEAEPLRQTLTMEQAELITIASNETTPSPISPKGDRNAPPSQDKPLGDKKLEEQVNPTLVIQAANTNVTGTSKEIITEAKQEPDDDKQQIGHESSKKIYSETAHTEHSQSISNSQTSAMIGLSQNTDKEKQNIETEMVSKVISEEQKNQEKLKTEPISEAQDPKARVLAGTTPFKDDNRKYELQATTSSETVSIDDTALDKQTVANEKLENIGLSNSDKTDDSESSVNEKEGQKTLVSADESIVKTETIDSSQVVHAIIEKDGKTDMETNICSVNVGGAMEHSNATLPSLSDKENIQNVETRKDEYHKDKTEIEANSAKHDSIDEKSNKVGANKNDSAVVALSTENPVKDKQKVSEHSHMTHSSDLTDFISGTCQRLGEEQIDHSEEHKFIRHDSESHSVIDDPKRDDAAFSIKREDLINKNTTTTDQSDHTEVIGSVTQSNINLLAEESIAKIQEKDDSNRMEKADNTSTDNAVRSHNKLIETSSQEKLGLHERENQSSVKKALACDTITDEKPAVMTQEFVLNLASLEHGSTEAPHVAAKTADAAIKNIVRPSDIETQHSMYENIREYATQPVQVEQIAIRQEKNTIADVISTSEINEKLSAVTRAEDENQSTVETIPKASQSDRQTETTDDCSEEPPLTASAASPNDTAVTSHSIPVIDTDAQPLSVSVCEVNNEKQSSSAIPERASSCAQATANKTTDGTGQTNKTDITEPCLTTQQSLTLCEDKKQSCSIKIHLEESAVDAKVDGNIQQLPEITLEHKTSTASLESVTSKEDKLLSNVEIETEKNVQHKKEPSNSETKSLQYTSSAYSKQQDCNVSAPQDLKAEALPLSDMSSLEQLKDNIENKIMAASSAGVTMKCSQESTVTEEAVQNEISCSDNTDTSMKHSDNISYPTNIEKSEHIPECEIKSGVSAEISHPGVPSTSNLLAKDTDDVPDSITSLVEQIETHGSVSATRNDRTLTTQSPSTTSCLTDTKNISSITHSSTSLDDVLKSTAENILGKILPDAALVKDEDVVVIGVEDDDDFALKHEGEVHIRQVADLGPSDSFQVKQHFSNKSAGICAKSGQEMKNSSGEYLQREPNFQLSRHSYLNQSGDIFNKESTDQRSISAEATAEIHGHIKQMSQIGKEIDQDFLQALEETGQRRTSFELSDICEELSPNATSSSKSSFTFSDTIESQQHKQPYQATDRNTMPAQSSQSSQKTTSQTTSDKDDNIPSVDFIQPRTTAQVSSDSTDEDIQFIWEKPLGLPSPTPGTPVGSSYTPVMHRPVVLDASTSTSKRSSLPPPPVYVELAFVPHHANSLYCQTEFFRRVRARYYVLSSVEPSIEVLDALVRAKTEWDDVKAEVTLIPTYDTDTLTHWFNVNCDRLRQLHIDLTPSASRCTINLQDHETSCAAYRLEF